MKGLIACFKSWILIWRTFWRKKKFSFAKKKTDTANQKKKKPKRLLQSQLKKKSFSFFYQSSSVPIKHKQTKRKVSFSSDFSFKITFKASQETRISISKPRIQSKRWTPSEGKSILHQHLFLLLSLLFIIFCCFV